MLRHRVQRPGDFYVLVAVLPGEDRLVVGLWQQQIAGLQFGEQFGQPPRGGAAHPVKTTQVGQVTTGSDR